MNALKVYSVPKEAVGNDDFSVRVRSENKEWKELFVYQVKVDMHNVRKASMVHFDMEGTVEVEVTSKRVIEQAKIRPLSCNVSFEQSDHKINFRLDNPCKLSIEINDDRFHNLHLFANPFEDQRPQSTDSNVLVIEPGVHRTEDILRLISEPNQSGDEPDVIYFSPGMHYLEETVLRIPSGKTVYLAGGSIVVGSMVCDSVKDVSICGRGILYLSNFERYSSFRGIRIVFSQNITVDGIVVIDPPHYSIYIGKSDTIRINNFKAFSTRGWSDGIDMMSSSNIDIHDVFMRNSDDCIAVYGSRWDFYGDTKNVSVKNSVLWADVAHPIMVGTHGNHEAQGDTIENLHFENIDILEHHEPQENYWGAMALNAGDMNVIRNVVFDTIRVEDFELGQLIDIRVIFNKDYNPEPGNSIKDITFRNIAYNGKNEKPSRIYGFDRDRMVENVLFDNVKINGHVIKHIDHTNFDVNKFVRHISFKYESE